MKRKAIICILLLSLLSGCGSIRSSKSTYDTREDEISLNKLNGKKPTQYSLPIKKDDFVSKVNKIQDISPKGKDTSYINKDFYYKNDVVIQTNYNAESEQLYDVLIQCNDNKREELKEIGKDILNIIPLSEGIPFIEKNVKANTEKNLNIGKYEITITDKNNQNEIYISGQIIKNH